MTPGTTSIECSRPVRRVGFTCDFLRFSIGEHGYVCGQYLNLWWLMEILTGASAWSQRGLEVLSVIPPQTTVEFEAAFGNPAALADYRDSATDAWARRYDVVDPDVFVSVFERLRDCDLVVGFEMSPTIRRYLHVGGQPYINFYVHPLRFLRDLCLGATTNAPWIAACLRAHEIEQHEIDSQVRRFRALFLKQQVAAFAVPQGLPILVGQTERDSVLIRGDRFVGWQEFPNELTSALAPFDAVVFLEHPERPNSNSIVEYLRSVHGKTVIATNANGYGVIFGNRDIPAVLTLASSLGVEAQTLGHSTQFLLDDPRKKFLVPGVDLITVGTHGHGVLERHFWDALLSGESSARGDQTEQQINDFELGENYLRSSLGSWAYRPLQHGVTGMTSRKTLVPSAVLTAERRDVLLGGLTGDFTEFSPPRAVARAHALGMQLDFLDPPLEVDEQRSVALDGPAAATYLAHGFHALESWGGWSSELKSQLVVPVSSGAVEQGAQLQISMRVRAFEGLLSQSPVLRISCEERVLGFVFFRTSGINQQTISFNLTPKTPLCRIEMELTALESPAARGLSADQRWLGFALSQLRISCMAPTGATEVSPNTESLQLWGIDKVAASLEAGRVGM